MSTLSQSTKNFVYAHINEHGSVFITEPDQGWFDLFFQERWTDSSQTELLGRFPSPQAAINAARLGETLTPEIGIGLDQMDLPADANDWLQHWQGEPQK